MSSAAPCSGEMSQHSAHHLHTRRLLNVAVRTGGAGTGQTLAPSATFVMVGVVAIIIAVTIVAIIAGDLLAPPPPGAAAVSPKDSSRHNHNSVREHWESTHSCLLCRPKTCKEIRRVLLWGTSKLPPGSHWGLGCATMVRLRLRIPTLNNCAHSLK